MKKQNEQLDRSFSPEETASSDGTDPRLLCPSPRAKNLALMLVPLVLSCSPQALVSSKDVHQSNALTSIHNFGTANPGCEAWTDWNKLCSRVGRNDEIYCASDPTRTVAPSEPFCLSSDDPELSYPPNKPSARASANRFCADELTDGGLPQCSFRKFMRRPFDGKSLSGRRHPYCAVWAEEHTSKPVCAEGNEFPELPRCDALAATGYRADNILYCAHDANEADRVCKYVDGVSSKRRGIERKSYPPKAVGSTNKTIIAVSDGEPYIVAMYCSETPTASIRQMRLER